MMFFSLYYGSFPASAGIKSKGCFLFFFLCLSVCQEAWFLVWNIHLANEWSTWTISALLSWLEIVGVSFSMSLTLWSAYLCQLIEMNRNLLLDESTIRLTSSLFSQQTSVFPLSVACIKGLTSADGIFLMK